MSQAGKFFPGGISIPIDTITGDIGGAIPPDGGGNVNLIGSGVVLVTGNAGLNTLTISITDPLPVANGGTGQATLTANGVLVGAGVNPITSLAVGTDGQVLLGSTGADPVFAALTSSGGTITFTPGPGSLNLEAGAAVPILFQTDSGSATPALNVITIAGGTNINTSGAASTVTVNLDTAVSGLTSLDMAAGGRIGTATSAGNTLLLQAYDVDGAAYTTFATLTANNTPTMDLDDSVTKAGQYIYRAGGTDVPVTDGGTGVSTLTDHGVLVGSGTSAITALGVGTDGQVLLGSTGADPVFATLTSSGATIAFTPGAGTLNLETGSTVAASFPTDSGTATPSSGVLTIAGGTNISTSGSGSTVTIDCTATPGMTWVDVRNPTQAMAVNTGYTTNDPSTVTYTLPAAALPGDRIAVVGNSANGWTIAQNAGQTIHFVSQDTTTGVGGSLSSTNRYDCVELICTFLNTEFVVRHAVGNITVV